MFACRLQVVGAMCHLVDYPDAPLEALMAHLQAPDFPTGGLIMDHTNELAKVRSLSTKP